MFLIRGSFLRWTSVTGKQIVSQVTTTCAENQCDQIAPFKIAQKQEEN